jgi:type IV pilus assembly protein PilC
MATNANVARAAPLEMGVAASGSKRRTKKVSGARKIRSKDLPVFTRQLSAMLASGMPVTTSLSTLEDQTVNRNFKLVIAGVRAQIEGGSMLSEALATYPDVFDELYVSMFRAGESGGLLAETAGRIAGYLEASGRLRRKVKSAMMYPTIVMIVALMIAAGMIIWIVPVFASIFSDFGAKLPGPTQFLVDVSNAVRANFLVAAGIIGGLVFSFLKFKKTERGAYLMDRLALRMPVIGDLVKKVALARFASTFAQLSRSGVPILRALEIVSFACGNKVLGKIILDSCANVERGEPLSEALDKSKEYPRMLVNMMAAGEKTGKVDDMMQRISQFYDDEVEAMLSGLTSLIEPLLMVFLGVIIGGIVVCMFLPIFKMHEIVNF